MNKVVVREIRGELREMDEAIDELKKSLKSAKADRDKKILELFAEIEKDDNQVDLFAGAEVISGTGEIRGPVPADGTLHASGEITKEQP